MKQAIKDSQPLLTDSARNFFRYLSKLERNTKALNLGHILRDMRRKKLVFEYRDIVNVLKSMEDADLGTVIYSVRGRAQRFQFKKGVKRIQVGKDGLAGRITVTNHKPSLKVVPRIKLSAPAPVAASRVITLFKDGEYYTFNIPSGFTKNDKMWLSQEILK